MKVTVNKDAAVELDVKRFYVPGVMLTDDCPKCGERYARDLGDDYLSYPVANRPFDFTVYCECGHEWTAKLILRLSVEVAS